MQLIIKGKNCKNTSHELVYLFLSNKNINSTKLTTCLAIKNLLVRFDLQFCLLIKMHHFYNEPFVLLSPIWCHPGCHLKITIDANQIAAFS